MAAKSSSSSLASSTTNNHTISNNARGGLLGGGASRVSKAAGSGGSTLMSRRGPSSAEALRAPATENSENPGTSPLQHRHLKAGGATTGTTRGGVSRKPKPTMQTAATSSVIDSRSTPSTPTSSLLLSSKKNRRNGLVPHAAGSPATASSPGPAATAAAALATTSSPSPGGKSTSVGTRKRRPATSKAASTLPSTSPVTARAGSGGSAATSSSMTRSSIGKAKRAAAAAAAGGGTRSLVIGGSNSNSNSTTPTGSSSSRATVPIALARPGTAVSPSLLVSPEGFLAPGSSSKRAGAPRSAAAAATGAASSGGGLQDGGGDGGGDSVSGSVAMSEGAASLVEGDKVRLQGGTVRDAVVRYVGETQFATGVWIGVELSPDAVPPGLNDGTVNGVSYFKCPPACGVFAKPDMFELVEEEGEGEDDEASPRGENGTDYGSDEATQAGAELLRHHKLFANEALEALKEEMSMIPGLEGLVESQQAVGADRVRFYLEVLENAAEAREAAAARLRSQIQETAKKYPSVFVFSPSVGDVAGGDDEREGSTDGDKKQDAGDGVGGDDVEAVEAQEEATASGEGEGEGEEGGPGLDGTAVEGEEKEQDQARVRDAGDGEGSTADPGNDPGEEQASSNPGDSKKVAKKGAEGQGNVFGIAGKFLRDVLHIPPGGGGGGEGRGGRDGGDASAVSQSSNLEGDEKKRNGGGGGGADPPTPVEAAVVDATSPKTPIAIAADSKVVSVGAAPGKSEGDEIDEPAVAEGEMEAVSVESVMVDTT
ncbi:unnamed protein product [Scytosiphon promiscuus]